jgi:thiol-disulfide isomerase/thioredoxin
MSSSQRLRKSLAGALVAGLLAVAALATACGTGQAAEPGSGQAASRGSAPAIAGTTYEGQAFDLASLAGKPVVVNFWFPSCPPCRAELPDMQKAFEKYGPHGVQFVGVQQLGLDSAASGKQFWSEIGVTFPAFPDQGSKVQAAYEVLSYPTTIFIDSRHNVVRKWTGLISHSELEKNIEALLAS